MAIFRAETKPITRGKGHNAVAASAYRAGQKLTDKNEFNDDAKTYDYSKKTGVLSADIVLPQSLKDADFTIERQELWSHVEQHEVTKADNALKQNARVAREWLLALPHELSDDENKALALEFTQRLADDLGVIGDCCIHKPTPQSGAADANVAEKDSNDQHSDPRNIHAHIMFTTRKARLSNDGTLMFAGKADSELSGQARAKNGLVKEADYLKQVREQWADMVNERLARYGHNLVDHRSYAERELDIKPRAHLGSYLADLENKGLATEKGQYNRDIIGRNELIFTRRANTLESLANCADGAADRTEHYLRSGNRATDWTTEQSQSIDRRFNTTKQRTELVEQRVIQTEQATERGERQAAENEQRLTSRTRGRIRSPNPYEQQLRTSDDERKQGATELDEQTIRFHQAAERAANNARRANSNARYRKPELISIVDEIDTLTKKTAFIFVGRHHEPSYTNRQRDILDHWATENDLGVGDITKEVGTAYKFFSDSENVRNHRDIVKLIRDPQTEEENYSKTHSDAQQDGLNLLTRDNTSNNSKTLNMENESVSVTPRRYRRP